MSGRHISCNENYVRQLYKYIVLRVHLFDGYKLYHKPNEVNLQAIRDENFKMITDSWATINPILFVANWLNHKQKATDRKWIE